MFGGRRHAVLLTVGMAVMMGLIASRNISGISEAMVLLTVVAYQPGLRLTLYCRGP